MPTYTVIQSKEFKMASKPAVMASIVDNGKNLNLGIREMYEDRVTNEMLPSKSGIFLSLNPVDAPVVRRMLLEALIMIGATQEDILADLKIEAKDAPKAKSSKSKK